MSAIALSSPPRNNSPVFKTALRAAWMAILLGFLVQGCVFLAKFGAGAKLPPEQMAVDAASGISWSMIVCGGVAIGSVAHRMRASAMGALGFLFGPAAFAASKAIQRSLGPLLGIAPDAIGPVMLQTAAAKGVEYAALGLILGAVIGTPRSSMKLHMAIGVGFGLLFAAVFTAINILNLPAGATLPTPKLAGTLTNEFMFPIGCSMVLYWVSRITSHGSPKRDMSDPTG